jgi:hypothetical protein
MWELQVEKKKVLIIKKYKIVCLGDTFGDITCFNNVEKNDPIEQKPVGFDGDFFYENSVFDSRLKNNLHRY